MIAFRHTHKPNTHSSISIGKFFLPKIVQFVPSFICGGMNSVVPATRPHPNLYVMTLNVACPTLSPPADHQPTRSVISISSIE
jgi:hypothetical protein